MISGANTRVVILGFNDCLTYNIPYSQAATTVKLCNPLEYVVWLTCGAKVSLNSQTKHAVHPAGSRSLGAACSLNLWRAACIWLQAQGGSSVKEALVIIILAFWIYPDTSIARGDGHVCMALLRFGEQPGDKLS